MLKKGYGTSFGMQVSEMSEVSSLKMGVLFGISLNLDERITTGIFYNNVLKYNNLIMLYINISNHKIWV